MSNETPTLDQMGQYIEIWKKVVDTQMHFNEMSVKSRQLGFAFVAATLGICVVLLSRKEDFWFYAGDWKLHVSVILLLAALVALLAVRSLDLGVYHKMLRGAVSFGEDFEERYMKSIFDLNKGMTQAVSHFSRHDDATVSPADDGRYIYAGSNKMTAESKIKQFYRLSVTALIVSAIAVFVADNHASFAPSKQTPTPECTDAQRRTACEPIDELTPSQEPNGIGPSQAGGGHAVQTGWSSSASDTGA